MAISYPVNLEIIGTILTYQRNLHIFCCYMQRCCLALSAGSCIADLIKLWLYLSHLLLLRSPARSLGFTILGEIFAYVTVFLLLFFFF